MPKRLTREMAVRIVADALMINGALIVALTARFLYLIAFERTQTGTDYNHVFWNFVKAYRNSVWLLTLICLVIFYVSGFYTHGRAYLGRYKALVVAQAVSLSYLLFGFLSYFIGGSLSMPRGALLLAWILSMGLLVAARVWALLWANVVRTERRLYRWPEERKVRDVLVIGGAGYLGSVLVRKLLDRGYDVTILDALIYGDESIRDLYGHQSFELIHDDLRNIEAVVRALQYADAVVHLAALVGDPACTLDEKLTLEINLAATRMIAEAARGFGVQRFIFASTCSVYGASDQLLDERSTLNPLSLYARTKLDSGRVLLALNNARFAPIILRFGTIYGLSPRPRFDLVINLLAAQAVCEKSITIFGGDQWRPFIHVDDAAQAILKCLEAPLQAVKGQILNVGSDDQNYRIAQIGDLIKELIPDVQVVHEDKDIDQRNYRVSFAKIRKHLGFTAGHSAAESILEIKAAIEDGRIPDYRDARYSNYKSLSEAGNAHFMCHTHITPLYASGLEETRPSSIVAPGLASTP